MNEKITLKELLKNVESDKECKYMDYSNPFVTEVVEFDCTNPFMNEDYIGEYGCQGKYCKYYEIK